MEGFRFLDGASAATRSLLSGRSRRRAFVPGDLLFRQDDAPEDVFGMERGRVKIARTTRDGASLTLGYVGRRGLVGINGTARGARHTVTAMAVTPVDTIAWPAAVLHDAMRRDAGLATGFATFLADLAEHLVGRLEEVSSPSVDARVARTLVRLAEAEARQTGTTGRVELTLSQADIAELTYTTVPTVSRLLGRWRAAGIVDGRRGHVTILKRDDLVALGRAGG